MVVSTTVIYRKFPTNEYISKEKNGSPLKN